MARERHCLFHFSFFLSFHFPLPLPFLSFFLSLFLSLSFSFPFPFPSFPLLFLFPFPSFTLPCYLFLAHVNPFDQGATPVLGKPIRGTITTTRGKTISKGSVFFQAPICILTNGRSHWQQSRPPIIIRNSPWTYMVQKPVKGDR